MPEEFVPLNPLQYEYKEILLKSNISKYNWVNGYSLSRNEKVRIPIKFLSAISGTNGQAAGNTFEEAITQGLCEVFERYCYFQVMYNRIPIPTIDLNTIKNPEIRQQISFYNKHNIEVKIKDFSLGRRFPVVGVLLIDHNIKEDPNLLKKDMFLYQVNAASALNLEDAIMRCFTERRQLFYSDNDLFLDSMVDTIWKHWVLNMKKRYKGASFQHNNDFKNYLTNRDVSFLMDKKSDIIPFDDLKNDFPCHSDFYNDIEYLLDICRKENKELIVINTQHPKIKFPSVQVIVPEMMWIEEGLKNENSFFLIYSLEDSWFEDVKTIKSFIKKAEEYLSCNLYYPEIKTIFGINLSFFRILAIANLKIRNYEEALNYFLVAKELEGNSKFDQIIKRLKSNDKELAEEASAIKNPFIYGWDFKEKAINEIIIPLEVNRILSLF
jgi:YcaO-like protein with predicted kinase domain